MAAGVFTDSAKNRLQALIDTIAIEGPAKYELNHQVDAVKTMLDQMKIMPQAVMVGSECIGFDVHWIKSGNETLNYNGVATQGEGGLEQTCERASRLDPIV